MSDPFDTLAGGDTPRAPRPEFARDLRSRLVAALDLPVQLPERSPAMTATTTTSSVIPEHPTTVPATALVPYLIVADGAAALDWYAAVFGATETMRVVGDDGRLGHAELAIGDVTMYLADEYPEYDFAAPAPGIASAALYLQVADVDAVFARAAAAGATVREEPSDQPDGDRRGTLTDPFGHRWMVAQPVARPSAQDYAERIAGSGYTVTAAAQPNTRTGNGVVPRLTVGDAHAAIAWYVEAFDAVVLPGLVEEPDGRVGHAAFSVAGAEFHVADEYPEYGIVAAAGATGVTLRLRVADVDAAYARAVAVGAEARIPPADQPYGERSARVADPYGFHWVFAKPLAAEPTAKPAGAIWASLVYADAGAGIAFLTDVLGFREQLVVPDHANPDVIVHSQLVWPEGGIVQVSTADRGNPYSEGRAGSGSLYMVTADPQSVWERCRAAGVEVVTPPDEPEYAPGTMSFGIRDFEGNLFSFGQYAGE